MFESLLGNAPLKAYLEKALLENRLQQTLLFTGLDGIGKSLFAREIANSLVTGSDLHILQPEGKSGLYAIDTLREMIAQEHAAPFQSLGKVFILSDVHRMQPAAANALLKTLEEPSPDTTFILLTSRPDELLPTILSRCTTLHFQPIPEELILQYLKTNNLPLHLAKFAHGSLGKVHELIAHPTLEEQRAILFSLLRSPPSYPDLMQSLEKIESLFPEEVDPVQTNRWADALFSYLFMWHRDQHVKEQPHLLFFPEEPKSTPIPLHKVEKALDKARFAYSRNMKLSHCLKIALEV